VDLAWEKGRNDKSISNQIETVQTRNLTLTLDIRKERVGEMRSHQGTYLAAHHYCRRYLDARAGTEPEPPLDAAASAGGHGPKGTVAKPLDGGTLSLAGNALAGEGTRGGAATLSGRHGCFSGSRVCGAREVGRGKKATKGRQVVAAQRAALLLTVAGGHAGTGAPPPPPAL
jgi:hypothetical protein